MPTLAGDTETLATGIGIVTAAIPDLPSLVAVIVAGPAVTAVTRPVVLTLAFVESDVAHVTARPVNEFPEASSVAALNCSIAPTPTRAVTGVTMTAATGTGITASVACPDLLPAEAVIVVCPVAKAAIAPPASTVATVGEDDDHVTVPVAIAEPFWSSPVALADAV